MHCSVYFRVFSRGIAVFFLQNNSTYPAIPDSPKEQNHSQWRSTAPELLSPCDLTLNSSSASAGLGRGWNMFPELLEITRSNCDPPDKICALT